MSYVTPARLKQFKDLQDEYNVTEYKQKIVSSLPSVDDMVDGVVYYVPVEDGQIVTGGGGSGEGLNLTTQQLANLNADHSKYLTEHQSLEDYYTKDEVDELIPNSSTGVTEDWVKGYVAEGLSVVAEEISIKNVQYFYKSTKDLDTFSNVVNEIQHFEINDNNGGWSYRQESWIPVRDITNIAKIRFKFSSYVSSSYATFFMHLSQTSPCASATPNVVANTSTDGSLMNANESSNLFYVPLAQNATDYVWEVDVSSYSGAWYISWGAMTGNLFWGPSNGASGVINADLVKIELIGGTIPAQLDNYYTKEEVDQAIANAIAAFLGTGQGGS